MKTVQPTPELIAAMNDMKAVIGRHQHLSASAMLAVASQFVGNLIALQDQTKVSPAMAMDLVARNIEIGNAAAIEGVMKSEGSA